MLLGANAAVQDYWLQQIHMMVHRVDQASEAVPLRGARPTLGDAEVSGSHAHPFRAELDQRRAAFKRRWTQAG
jgi:hypothetical protein